MKIKIKNYLDVLTLIQANKLNGKVKIIIRYESPINALLKNP